jgi:hypothetical protein
VEWLKPQYHKKKKKMGQVGAGGSHLATQEAEIKTLSGKHPSQKRPDGVAQGVGPEFNPSTARKEKKSDGQWREGRKGE